MKKILLIALCLFATTWANAETVSGEVVKAKKNKIIVQTNEGENVTLYTTDGTTYRQKKIHRKGKMKTAGGYYEPMVEEDDWVEITYTPAKDGSQMAEIQEVIVYND